MKTYLKNLMPIWHVLFIVYLLTLFMYQLSIIEIPTILFTVIYIGTSTMISLFVIGIKSDNKKLVNILSGVLLTMLFICSIGVARYIDHHEQNDFKNKVILLTGASSAFQSLNLTSETIVSIEVGEYTKGDGFPFKYKVKIVTTDAKTPYYFECADYQCKTMVRYTYPTLK